jgi:nucleotide-binding universal stress UspA family protein
MKTLTYFVPVDFSNCSYNALQYAIMLARFSGGQVKLCHVIDLAQVPESDNSVVVSFALDRLEKKVMEKMKSLDEIISLAGVTVEKVIAIGNVRITLLNEIEKANPQIIVLGKNTETHPRAGGIIAYITKHARVPVLAVPRSHNPRVPNKAMLATDLKSDKVREFAPLFEIMLTNSKELSVLAINGKGNTERANKWVKEIKSTYGVDAKILHQSSEGVIDVSDFIRADNVDLLCTINKAPRFLQKLFRESAPLVANQVDVPVLMLTN